MRHETDNRWTPPIIVSAAERDRLMGLAVAVMAKDPDVAEELMFEMERAVVVEAGAVPANVVRMGSTVRFRSDDGVERRVTLVFPDQADISQGRISILTPIGAALIGLSEGELIMWTTRDGRDQKLTVLSVEPAEAAADPA